MTQVYLEQDGNRYTVFCKDHAESSEGCAAISTLCCTLAGYLHNIDCTVHAEKIDSGDVRICFTGDGERAQAAFEMTSVGFLQLEKSYPSEVRVDFTEID